MKYHLASIIGISLIILLSLGRWSYYPGHRPSNNSKSSSSSEYNTLDDKYNKASSLATIQDELVKTIADTRPSVVSIIASRELIISQGDPRGQYPRRSQRSSVKVGGASGIIVSTGGLIITNKHVIQDTSSDYTVILHDGTMLDVQYIWTDPVLDLAVLQIRSNNNTVLPTLKPASFASMNDRTQVGQLVLAIGNALTEYNNSVSLGIISAKQRQLESDGNSIYIGLLQTDTPINPGNSGGPLVNTEGKIIGMNTAVSAQAQGIGFAIPLSQELINTTLQTIQQRQKIVRPLLGINYIDISHHSKQQYSLDQSYGALVTEVGPQSAAYRVGLLSGDIIIGIDEIALDREFPLLYELYTKHAGEVIVLHIWRHNKELKMRVPLGMIPAQ